MNFAKRMLLGSAAAMAVVGGAQAADLPLAEPVEYVKVCNTYGEGFFYIPGTDTCLEISGYVRAEYRADDGNNLGNDDGTTTSSFFARAQIQFDARTETEYGTLRSYAALRIQRTDTNDVARIPHAFVQFAGLTAGRTTSFFDFYANGNIFGAVAGSDIETNLIAYTATFGTGFSATLALEDAGERNFSNFDRPYGQTQTWPDIVANLRVEQGWGTAQLSGALHNANPAFRKDELGWAVQAGAVFNLPFLTEGDTFTVQGAYTDGAIGYLNGANGFNGNYNTTASDFRTFGLNGDTKLVKSWNVTGELLHYWTPSLRSAVAGSYQDVNDRSFFGVNLDFKQYIGVVNLVWSPVKNLDIGGELGYTNTKYDSNVVDDVLGYDSFSGIMRVQRKF
jgi:hypothetical protein